MKRAAAGSAAVQNGAAQNSESQSAGTQGGAAQNTGDQNAAAAKMAGSTKSRGKLLSILVVLVLLLPVLFGPCRGFHSACDHRYPVLKHTPSPIFEVATVVFLIAMMAFHGCAARCRFWSWSRLEPPCF